MSANLAPWALFATFVAGLVATVLLVVRMVIMGKLVPRVTHLETVEDRDGWRKAYETAAAANATHSANQAKMVEALDDLTTAVNRMLVAGREAA